MYEIKAEGLEALQKKFETFGQQIEELHKKIPEELVEWQRVDMRRQYPNMTVEETRETVRATMLVWPRSRLEQEPGYQRPKRPVVRTGPAKPRIKGVGRPPPSVRPILREELERKLVERIDAHGKEAMKWP
jgi:hypothetical protein